MKDLPENSGNKNVEVKITKCTTTQTDNENYSKILKKVNKYKYELYTLEKHLETVRAKLSCEKNDHMHRGKVLIIHPPKQYESRRVLALTVKNQALAIT